MECDAVWSGTQVEEFRRNVQTSNFHPTNGGSGFLTGLVTCLADCGSTVFTAVRNSDLLQLFLKAYAKFKALFAKLRTATISLVMYLYPSVCPHGTTRLPLDRFFENVQKTRGSFKCDKNNGYFTW